MSALLKATGLAYPGRLARCDLALAAGSLTMLVGPNGAGKTSLLHALAGIGASQGRVTIGGASLAVAPGARRAQLLSYLPATRDAPWPLSAADYVALGWPGRDAGMRAREALADVEADAFAERRIDRLSTGERARIMLARSLVARSRVLLLDEPIANLDPQWRIAILDRLRAEATRGAALLVSVHDLDIAIQRADRIIVMAGEQIIADGAPQIALRPETLASVFSVVQNEGRLERAAASS